MTVLPGGTVTFLFSDIEDSTRLWQAYPQAMAGAHARHDEIIREAVALRGGVIYKTIGDAFQIVFPTAPKAVQAALDAQQRLQAETWAMPEPLRVRMAMHTGAVDPDTSGDYRSPILNRLGRLMSAGHGGQVLLTRATAELARDSLPADAFLHDLGEHRLKDLDRPEHLYQLAAPELAREIPALRTPDRLPTNLPAQPNRFIGREEDVAALLGILRMPDVRLVTLTGPGGTGKTRLALEVAAAYIGDVDDVLMVDLASMADPTLVPGAVAKVIGAQERPGVPTVGAIRDALGTRTLLLVLDNMEQVIESASFVGELLAACSNVKVVATSRIRLHVRSEREYPVRPLELPDPDRIVDVATIDRCESVRLFVERAQAVRPSFRLADHDPSVIAGIVARLDGLPLAIELAGARIRMLPPEAMLRRLESRLPFLTGGSRDLPLRQQTMLAAIDWSYDLLAPAEQALFRRLSVFAGGWTLEAAEAVCAHGSNDSGIEVFERLERLVDQSLVLQAEMNGEPRFRMLETVREYGLGQLRDHGEMETVRRQYACYVASLVELPDREPPADELARWLDLVEREHDNVRTACEWALAHDDPLAVRMIGHVGKFWVNRGHMREGASWLERALQADMADVAFRDRGRCLHLAANMASFQGDFSRGRARYREALDLYQELGDKRRVVLLHAHLASCADGEGDYGDAMRLCAEAIRLARNLDGHDLLSYALNVAGYMAYLHGDLGPARLYLEEAVEIARQQEDLYLPFLLHSCADLCRAEGDLAGAESLYRESLSLAWRAKLGLSISSGLIGLAALRAIDRQAECAAMLLGAEERFRRSKGFDVDHDLAQPYEDLLTEVRNHLAPEAFERAWAEGAAMPIDDAIAEALGGELDQLDAATPGSAWS